MQAIKPAVFLLSAHPFPFCPPHTKQAVSQLQDVIFEGLEKLAKLAGLASFNQMQRECNV